MLGLSHALHNMKAPKGYVFLALVPNYYGKGASQAEAFANAEKAGGRGPVKAAVLYIADPKVYLSEMGDLRWPVKGKEAIKVGHYSEK